MSFLSWIVLGLLVGFIASKIVNQRREGVFLDIVLGTIGSIVSGVIFGLFRAAGATGINLYSLIVAVIGAFVVLCFHHAVHRTA
jgi:uncharacterized membrane protein YeaQ/YmgE (transglycosylase-associated protein family)